MCPSPSSPAPALYALLLDAGRQDGDGSLDICRESGFLGVGWGVGSAPFDWPSYQQRAIEQDGFVHAAVQEMHDLPDGSLIWTRDPADGVYYLAKVTGPWQYLHGGAPENAGLYNARPARIVACRSVPQVPEAIAGCFVGRWVIQRIHDDHATQRSEWLFDELTGGPGAARPTLDEVLTSYLDDKDVHSLVCTYLQRRFGYLAMPPARHPGVSAWEYVLRDGYRRQAIVRARRGWSPVPRDAPSLAADRIDDVFVFSPTGSYGPDPAPNVTEIDYDDIIEFMRDDRWNLPRKVEFWVSRALDEMTVRDY